MSTPRNQVWGQKYGLESLALPKDSPVVKGDEVRRPLPVDPHEPCRLIVLGTRENLEALRAWLDSRAADMGWVVALGPVEAE